MRRRAPTIVALVCLAVGIAGTDAASAASAASPAGPGATPAAPKAKQKGKGGGTTGPSPKGKRRSAHPWGRRVKAAKRFARRRTGAVSFAIVDERGRIHGFNRGARYSSASLVKAMLMVAYLRQARGRRLNGGDRGVLGPMITVSDNGAADAAMGRVGTGGLAAVARRAGMRRFIPSTSWGGSQVTARDQARFFVRIRSLLPERHRSYGLGLLRRIAPGQRWGIPQGAPKRARVHFKGGWFPGDGGWRVHQGALLRVGRAKLGLAVLTEGGPGFAYGQATIRGVTARMLKGYKPPPKKKRKKKRPGEK